MRKNMMKFGTMALAASMMLTPATSVFAADESQETVIAAEENVSDIDTDNTITSTDNDINMNVDETFDEDDYGVEPTGIITTPYKVTASAINIRSGRGTSYSIIGTVSKGQTVDVYNNSLSKGWVKVKFSGSVGYAYAKYNKKK